MYPSFWQLMTNEDLLEVVSDDRHLDHYRKQCKQVLLARFEAQKENIEL